MSICVSRISVFHPFLHSICFNFKSTICYTKTLITKQNTKYVLVCGAHCARVTSFFLTPSLTENESVRKHYCVLRLWLCLFCVHSFTSIDAFKRILCWVNKTHKKIFQREMFILCVPSTITIKYFISI